MGGFFDFSNPAAKAKDLLIKNAKSSMVLVIVLGILLGIGLLVVFSKALNVFVGIIVAVVILILSIALAICIRNSTYYRLAILEACETITHSEGEYNCYK